MKPTALHERIRSDIEGAILSGALAPGDRIPAEIELMERYGCARMTVSKALSSLSAAGLLDRRKRAGSFVARPRAESMVLDVPDLASEIAARGQSYGWRMTDRAVHPIGSAAWPERGASGGAVLDVRGIHYADGAPFACEERLVSLAVVPAILDADFSEESPGSWLLHHIPWTEAENRIGAIAATSAVADALGVEPGTACLSLERRTWRGADSVTLVRQYFLAGQYQLIARFGRSDG